MWRRKAPLYGEWKQNGEVTCLVNGHLVLAKYLPNLY